jgi:hypothetical protein
MDYKSNSINIIKNIYSKYSKDFLNYAIDILNTIKMDNSTINENEINDFIFNSVLRDIHLSKYMNDKIFNLVEVDIIPESYTTYGEDFQEIEDTNVGDETFEKNKYKNKIESKYNEELATDLWSNIMIYGGLNKYQELINNIIKDVEKINKEVADKMK